MQLWLQSSNDKEWLNYIFDADNTFSAMSRKMFLKEGCFSVPYTQFMGGGCWKNNNIIDSC